MATIGSIAVNVVAKTDKFIAGLNSAQTRIGKFVSSIGALQTAVVGLGLAGFARLTLNVIETGDALFDTAQKIGIATDALGALRFAAEQLGTDASALDRGLTFLNKNIGMAQQGSKAATEAFGRLGIKVSELQGMTVDQTFLAVADAIDNMSSATEQAAAAQQIFGRSGAELLPILRASQEEIIKLGDAAAATGGLISDEDAKKMSDAADALKELKLAMSGLSVEFTAAFVPAITTLSGWLTTAVKLFRGLQLGIEMTTLSFQGLVQDTSLELEAATKEFKALQADIQGRSVSGSGPLKAPPSTREVEKNTDKTAKNTDKQVSLQQRMATGIDRIAQQRGDTVQLVVNGMR